jgi:hypothetical protein
MLMPVMPLFFLSGAGIRRAGCPPGWARDPPRLFIGVTAIMDLGQWQ